MKNSITTDEDVLDSVFDDVERDMKGGLSRILRFANPVLCLHGSFTEMPPHIELDVNVKDAGYKQFEAKQAQVAEVIGDVAGKYGLSVRRGEYVSAEEELMEAAERGQVRFKGGAATFKDADDGTSYVLEVSD